VSAKRTKDDLAIYPDEVESDSGRSCREHRSITVRSAALIAYFPRNKEVWGAAVSEFELSRAPHFSK